MEAYFSKILDQKLGPRPNLHTLEDLYEEVAILLEHFHKNQSDKHLLLKDSKALKQALLESVEACALDLTPTKARQQTMTALSQGIFTGALDGTLTYQHQHHVKHPALKYFKPEIKKPLELLWANLDSVLEVARSSWYVATIDDLQLLSGYGKYENRRSLKEGEELEVTTRSYRLPFLVFILGCFKAGYAMGVIDSAVMLVGNERPGTPATG